MAPGMEQSTVSDIGMTMEQVGSAVLFANDYWELRVELEPRINPCRLVHKASGRVVVDEDYCYEVTLAASEGPGFTAGPQEAKSVRYLDLQLDEDSDPLSATLTITGRLDFGPAGPTDLVLEHQFTLFTDTDRFQERIALVHRFGRDSHRVDHYRFGFRKVIFDRTEAQWRDHADEFRLTPIPFRRRRGQAQDYLKQDYSGADLVPGNWSGANLPNRAAEAWSWHGPDGGYVFSKYSQEHIEFAVVDGQFYASPASHLDHDEAHVPVVGTGHVCLCFGGAGRVHGAPGGQLTLGRDGNARFAFGITTIEPFSGGWEAGHRKYAALQRRRGHVVPVGFDPPVHWNELYELSWRGGTNAPLQELPELWQQAAVASQIGAEAFYFDPVWDVFEGSTIWDEERLGSLPDFVARLGEEYHLKLSLHLMMHTKLLDEDPRIFRRTAEGEIDLWTGLYTGGHICPGSSVWRDLKVERLCALAEAGVTFFMFDFLDYEEPEGHQGHSSSDRGGACWSPDHGHRVPMTLEEHSSGIIEVISRVKRRYPHVLIEAHDRITGGLQDYLPLYYEHGREHSYDEHWGFEYMWDSYMDLLSGKALSLYEYNLAYDIPLYLHVNLHFDNDRALAFWWYASTCRHLGIGGVKPGGPTWGAHVTAMELYLGHKRHFTQGRFVGLAQHLHAHVLDDARSAVIVAFNLTGRQELLQHDFAAADLGIPESFTWSTDGLEIEDGSARLRVTLDALTPWVCAINWSDA